jgi:hypothetical protein
MHSEWSDGSPTVQEIAEACVSRGYQYAAVTDHSYGLKIAGGMSMAEAVQQRQAPIALLPLDATRRMTIRAKAAPRRSINVKVETGSLLVMDYATQIHYTHGVPKTSAAIGEHISLAFRDEAGPAAAESQWGPRHLPVTSFR